MFELYRVRKVTLSFDWDCSRLYEGIEFYMIFFLFCGNHALFFAHNI